MLEAGPSPFSLVKSFLDPKMPAALVRSSLEPNKLVAALLRDVEVALFSLAKTRLPIKNG